MTVRLAVVGWDSATFDVIDPLLSQGRLPVMASLLQGGHRAVLRSTWPPMTDCAWTSAFTGSNAGRHGIFGSWYRAPGAYECRYFSARDRRAPALWDLTDDVRHLVWNVPMTFPPDPVSGAMVAGYGAPPGATFCGPASLQGELAARWQLDDLLDRAPHGSLADFLADLVRGLEVQSAAIPWAAEKVGADCVSLVWPQIDRAQHFFWRFRGSDHPLSDAVDRVYEAMDKATGRLLESFSDADVLIVSDHGAGPLAGDVNMGAWLASNGHAAYSRGGAARPLVDAAWALPAPVRRLGRRLAPGFARRTMAATLTGALAPFDWARTDAFVGFHGDLWLNLEGREPQGGVSRSRADGLLTELRDELLLLEDPRTGHSVFSAAYPRDEIYAGPLAEMAPDLMLDSWTAGYRIAPGRGPADEVVGPPASLAGVEAAWSADHRPEGIFVAAGPHIAAGHGDDLSLHDLCPTALALVGSDLPDGIDGRPATQALTEAFLAAHPIQRAAAKPRPQGDGEYSAAEATAVAEHLKDLGYIE